MNSLPLFIQITFMLLGSVYLMLKLSFAMLEKRNIIIFLPLLLVALEFCMEAALFYFQFPLSGLPGYLHDFTLIFTLLFYTFLFGGVNIGRR